MDRQVRTQRQASAESTAPCPATVSLRRFAARRALFIGAALAAMSLPVNIADNSGWFTLNAASASHDKSNPDAPGHGGGGGSGGGSGGSAVGGGGGGGGSGGSSGGAGVGSGGAGNPGSGSAGGGQNSGDAAERDLQEAQLESFVEDESVSGNAAGAPALADALMPNGGQDDMPAVTQIIGATGVTTLDADEELALIAAGWN